jgi:hypothetical protein
LAEPFPNGGLAHAEDLGAFFLRGLWTFLHVLAQGFGFERSFLTRPWFWRKAFALPDFSAATLDRLRAGHEMLGRIGVCAAAFNKGDNQRPSVSRNAP